jgi:LuxR family transcriptional regulator, transcriptional regulator of spore coat protein
MSSSEMNGEPTLSAREREILELVARGLSAKEVAGEIGIAPRTVDRHIENIRLKMRARNRVHMVTQAVRGGQLQLTGTEERLDQVGLAGSPNPEQIRIELKRAPNR